jgi:hypothetical protein
MARQSIQDLAASLKAFYTKLDAFIAAANANQANSDALVQKAIEDTKASEGADVDAIMTQLAADLAAEAAKVPEPPTPPVVDVSNL